VTEPQPEIHSVVHLDGSMEPYEIFYCKCARSKITDEYYELISYYRSTICYNFSRKEVNYYDGRFRIISSYEEIKQAIDTLISENLLSMLSR
jgi:hypothetical protein